MEETSKPLYKTACGFIGFVAVTIDLYRNFFNSNELAEKDQRIKDELTHYINEYNERLKQYQIVQKESITKALEQLPLTIKYSRLEKSNDYLLNWWANKEQKIINSSFNLDSYLKSISTSSSFQIDHTEQKKLWGVVDNYRQESFKFSALVNLGEKFGVDQSCSFEQLERSNEASYGTLKEYAITGHINHNILLAHIVKCFNELEITVKEQIANYIIKGEPAFHIVDIYKNDFDLKQSQLELVINMYESTNLVDKPEL